MAFYQISAPSKVN